MISEITLSKKFTAFWNEILPNSKNYIRLLNGGLIERVHVPFEPAIIKNNVALVNVLSFELFRTVVNRTSTIDELSNKNYFESNQYKFILNKSLDYLSRFKYGKNCILPLKVEELNDVIQLYNTMRNRYLNSNKEVIVDPVFAGCGFINESNGDLISDTTLVEIKSGERNFSVIDLRQMLIYCTLNHFSQNSYKLEYIEFFNPRMGISFTEEIENFCQNLSALSSQELFTEIQKFITDINFVEEYGT